MRKLSEDFRRMLDALAHQDAAEYLPMRDKYRELGIVPSHVAYAAPAADGRRVLRRRVALLGAGRGDGGHVDYAVDACRRQRAGLDILVPGTAASAPAKVRDLLVRLRRDGVDAQLVQLPAGTVQALDEYIAERPSLLLLVALAGDALSRAFTDSIASRGRRSYVPVVMIQDGPAQMVPSMSFA